MPNCVKTIVQRVPSECHSPERWVADLRAIEDQDSEPDQQPGDHVAERDDFEHKDVDRVQRRPDQVLLGEKLPGDEDGAATLLEQVSDFGFGQAYVRVRSSRSSSWERRSSEISARMSCFWSRGSQKPTACR